MKSTMTFWPGCFTRMKRVAKWIFFLLLLISNTLVAGSPGTHIATSQKTIRVGADMPYKTPSAVADIAHDGDTIEILAGTYPGDVAVWKQNNITLRGVSGTVHILAKGQHAEGKAIWVIKGSNITIENIEFIGASVPDHNGAGIRFEGTNLTIRNCKFLKNENGILTGENRSSEILIEHCEFAQNGFGDGYTHNIYIGKIKSLTVRFCNIYGAISGHNVKSRAAINQIAYNRIMDERDGNSSYAVDIPNGGQAFLVGNVIQQGLRSENYSIISYGAEALSYPRNELFVVNNTIVNDRNDWGVFVKVNRSALPAKIINNIFYGIGEQIEGPAIRKTNLVLSKNNAGGDPGGAQEFVESGAFDFRLRANSHAVNSGTDPALFDDPRLFPNFQYNPVIGAQKREIIAEIDIGAFEYQPEIAEYK